MSAESAVALAALCRGSDTGRLRAIRIWLEAGRRALASAAEAGDAAATRVDPAFLDDAEALVTGQERSSPRVAQARQAARLAIQAAGAAGIRLITWWDAGYPTWLRAIPDPPVVLWCRGHGEVLAEPGVALVGSRDATPAGLAVAQRLARGLAEHGLTVISGFARGVDAAAHRGAVAAGGKTVAVLGSGADVIYPRGHLPLVAGVEASGLLVSELPPGSPPLAFHFPLRNRLISGLSRAVVVVEAAERSGSLITARAALEQGRDVLAVPGGVLSGRHRGCHALIKDGARLVETVRDVLDEIGPSGVRSGRGSAASADNHPAISDLETIMAAGEPYDLDEIAGRTGWPISRVLGDLGRLEVAGRVVRSGANSFVRLDEPAMDIE